MKRVLVSGASGFVGRHLVPFLEKEGCEVFKLVRTESTRPCEIYWNPKQEKIDLAQLEHFTAVFNLAGESIAEGRWSASKKNRLFLSRCRDTWLLSQAFKRVKHKPSFFFSASAIGYYGNRGEEEVAEEASVGNGFLANLCKEWEGASQILEGEGIRVVWGRLGNVISFEGGMVAKIAPFFKWGVGGQIGAGQQWMSWIALEDLIHALYFLFQETKLTGVFNLTSPYPVRNAQFTAELAERLGVKVRFSIPPLALRLIWGEKAEEVVLSSIKAVPTRLVESGFKFAYPHLKEALEMDMKLSS